MSAGLVALWVKNLRPAKDDPRLSKGLQLLQSKIAVLEDLADRTDTQVQQLNLLIEKKAKELQEKMLEADRGLQQIEQSMLKSKEMAKLFEDKIPHKEILERQNTAKYVKAARMAHQGISVNEICKEVNISAAEVEFIAKVNKNQLMFCEESLPEWAQETSETSGTDLHDVEWIENSPANTEVTDKKEVLRKIGERFQQEISRPTAMTMPEEPPVTAAKPEPSVVVPVPAPVAAAASTVAPKNRSTVEMLDSVTMTNGKMATIRPVLFKKINLDQLG